MGEGDPQLPLPHIFSKYWGWKKKRKIGEEDMKTKRRWLLCPLVILALLLCAIPAYADIPTIPHAFYGTLTMNGSPAPVGTVVKAKVVGVECGSITTTVAGQYGGSGAFDAKLTVSGDIETGATISFFVNDIDTGQTYAFSPGAVTQLNLTVTIIDNTPPSVTITALSPDPTNDNTPTFTGTATDTQSNISSVEYKVDSGAWTAAIASDGAFDSLSEGYTFTTSALSDGAHTVYVRATDAASTPNTTAEADYATDSFTVDTTAPAVSSISPVANATGVAVTTTVTATFSEAMNASTITTSSFTLKAGTTPVSGSVSYNSGTYTATFTPSANLSYSTTYTATLSTAITDAVGNSLTAEYSWSFTTVPTTVIPGDANGDGVVNALDITKVERIIAGLDAQTPGADANQDGNINALDITKVERIIAGLG
jgi:hypothetical protein